MVIEWKGKPRPQARVRCGNGVMYEPRAMKEYKASLGCAARQVKECLTGKLAVRIWIYKNVKIDSRQYGDIDNHVKAILDALNGIAYGDDSAIVELEAHKEKSKDEGVRIEIERIEGNG